MTTTDRPHVADACPDGAHTPGWDRGALVCTACGLSAQTIVDYLGHDLR
jgi:hypothetical protein